MPWRICLLGVIAATLAGSARGDPIWPTTGFGDLGVVTVQEGAGIADPSAVAFERDGSIVVAGNTGDTAVLSRFSAGGRRIGFGTRHHPVRIATGSYCKPGLAVRQDGTILMACGEMIVAFAPNGRVRSVASISGAHLDAVATDELGDTVAAGSELVRLRSDGQLDPTFGTGGRVPLHSAAVSFAVDGGRILVVSDGSISGYRWDGSPDAGFGSDGVASYPGFTAHAVSPYSHWILAGGAIGNDAAVVRFIAGGLVDKTYGDAGIATWDPTPALSENISALAARKNGAVDAAVTVTGPDDQFHFDSPEDWVVQRVMATGELGVAAGGPDYTDPTTDCIEEVPVAIAEQPNGMPVVAGVACADSSDQDTYSLLARYSASLVLDAGTPLRLHALGLPVVHGETVTLRLSVNGPCRIVARAGALRATTIDVAHGPVTVRVSAGRRRPHAVVIRAYDARGYFTGLVVRPTGQATPVPPSPQ